MKRRLINNPDSPPETSRNPCSASNTYSCGIHPLVALSRLTGPHRAGLQLRMYTAREFQLQF